LNVPDVCLVVHVSKHVDWDAESSDAIQQRLATPVMKLTVCSPFAERAGKTIVLLHPREIKNALRGGCV